MLQQYWNWVTGLLHGDLGTSLAAQIPVSDLLGERVVNSAFLVLLRGHHLDPALDRDRRLRGASPRPACSTRRRSIVTLLFAALPEFVVGVVLVVLFATTVFQWLPAVSLIRHRTSRGST